MIFKFQVSSSKFHNRASRGGQTMLLMVLILTSTLLSVAIISSLTMLFQIRQSSDFTNSAKAIFAAETGAEWWRYDIRKQSGSGAPITSQSINASLSNGSSFEIFPTGNPNQVKIVGTAGNSKRAVLVTIQTPKGLLACNTDQQIDLVMIIDMTATQPNTDLIETAGRAFIDKIMVGATSNVHVGVTQVKNIVEVITNLTADRGWVDISISALSLYTWPNFVLHQAIDNAIIQLGSPVYDRDDNPAPDAILIITDSPPSSPTGTVTTQSDNAKNENIKIYVVNVGSANDPTFLKSISSGDGYYFESSDYSNLEDILINDLLDCP